MESTTKTKLTKEELQRLVLEQFGCGLKDYREFGEGHMNTIYHITLERPFVPSSVPGEGAGSGSYFKGILFSGKGNSDL